MYTTTVFIGKNIICTQSSYAWYRSAFGSLRNMSTVIQHNPIELSIRKKLVNSLNPSHVEVINESYMHNVPKGSETHFKVVVVSDVFKDKSLLKRHQLINNLLQAELDGGVHALSIVAKTPDQWEDNSKIAPSPACRGGFGR
ncbi:PREDICTED: bolA-like protein DDB_G0274169 [Dufourea novaeangliae]|uniref:bolA-like protein DDB_G0274169 n=1 Tax=Dufourea novaeangliae TaxID=178035 RepID=UPI0007670439|nr:PREDICTED: bolA-like protein DDB_G0274169 [Dufourea novaeangliae]